jgi:hypothetical protein
MRETRAKFEPLYRATTYRVDIPEGRIDIRVGQTHPTLDALLAQLGVTDWAFVTAWNPRSTPSSAETNSLSQQRLIRAIRESGLVFFEGKGIPDDPGWSAERSVWIAGISRREAAILGARFNQNAVLVGTVGEEAELVFCD